MDIYLYTPADEPLSKTTSQPAHVQLWHELEILQYLPNKGAPAPYITQGKIYFMDAWESNWRSAGLLYYYSFLNLAKAHLINSNTFSVQQVQTTAVHHGLSCPTQQVTSFTDFTVNIQPPGYQNKNVFSTFYEKITGQPWPFNTPIPVTVKDILPYCTDISDEAQRLYNIPYVCEPVVSLVKENQHSVWLEILCSQATANMMAQEITGYSLTTAHSNTLTPNERLDWLHVYPHLKGSISNLNVVKSPPYGFNSQTGSATALAICRADSKTNYKGHATPVNTPRDDVILEWFYSPKIQINGQNILWHPIFSNYLFSFALGSVLRYQPHLLVSSQPDYFLAEAWIRQCPISTLRDFVLFYDPPGVVVIGR